MRILEGIPVEGQAITGIKAATLLLFAKEAKIPASLAKQLALHPDTQRALLRTALNANGTGKVAHHVIPLEAIKAFPELMQKAAKGGFNINGVGNGALLRTADHIGGHPQYSLAVFQQLKTIPGNLSATDTATAVQSIANKLQGAIRENTFLPVF